MRRWKRTADLWKEVVTAHAVKGMLASCMFIGCTVFGFLLFSPIVQVREIQVTRESPRLDIEDVQVALTPMFGRHLFFLSSLEVADLLKESIPDISAISVSKTYPSTLHVRVQLHPLAARLRILEPDQEYATSQTGATVDFLTDQGMYVATTAVHDTETLPEIVVVDWGVRPDPGTRMVRPSFLERMNAAELTLLRQFGKEVSQRRIFLRAQEFHVTIDGIDLWFDTRTPLEKQLNRYRLFLREVESSEVKQYIDLRVADRVVYQ